MLWVLALEWRFSYWLLIDVCNGFGLMLCKLVFNWFMSLIKNKVSSFLKFEAAHFIELDSSSYISTHPPVILHEGLARSCRIHCINKRKTNSSLWRSCPSVWIKGGGKWSYRHSPTVCNGHPNFRRARVNYSNMDSATSPSSPRRMTGWEAYCEIPWIFLSSILIILNAW